MSTTDLSGNFILDRDDVFAMTDAHLHGLLAPADRAWVDEQVSANPVWRAAMEEARRRHALLAAQPAAEPSEDLLRRTLERAERVGTRRERHRRRVRVGIPLALVAVVAVFGLVNLYFARLAPTPYDLQVFGQTQLAAGAPASLRVRLVDAERSRPLAGVPVEVELVRPQGSAEGGAGGGGMGTVRLASFTTDASGSGSPRFELPDWAAGEYELRITARPSRGGEPERIVRPVRLERERRVMLSTDKPVYRPGQTILMRSLALRTGSGRPVGGESAVFEITDPKGNLIFRERTVTSEFGIASAECPIADLVTHGTYQIRVEVGAVGEGGRDAATQGAAGTESVRTVEVKEYVLPKFRVAVVLDRPFYEPGQIVRGSVEASYFFGQPVAGGTAEVTLTPERVAEREIQVPAVALDEAGRGVFEVRLPDRLIGAPRDGGDAAVGIAVTVRDAAGQEVSRRERRLVTNRPLRLEVVPEGGRLVPGIEQEVFVFATTADGRPADVRVSVEGLDGDLRTGELGIASFRLTPSAPEAGEVAQPVRLTLRARGPDGRSAGETVELPLDGSSSAFVLRTDAAAYEGGATMTVTAFGGAGGGGGGGGGGDTVFVDLIRDGQTILTDAFAMTSGRGEHQIDLPPDLTGTLRLVAYRFDEHGVPVRREQTVVVRPAGELNVVAEADQPTYRPGETANLTLRVTDSSGNPAPGAISLAVVDEVVFGVLDERPGMEAAFFGTDQELLEPVCAVYPWDPWRPDERLTESERRQLARAVAALSATPSEVDREAIFRRLVEEGFVPEEMLDALGSDRLPEMLDWMEGRFSAETMAILRGDASELYSLRETTLPEKRREVDRRQREWRQLRKQILGWSAFIGASALITTLLVLASRVRGFAAVVLALLITVLVIGMMLPALGKARRAARQLKDQTSIRSIAQGLELARDDGLLPAAPGAGQDAAAPPRVREWFPETLFWRPELITDDEGEVRLEVPLADSITSWRLAGSAVTREGRLGSLDGAITVFQPFFVDLDLPVALTQGDVFEIPAVVYNYLDAPQAVRLEVRRLEGETWFELLGDAEASIQLAPNEVRRVGIPIRAVRNGAHRFEIAAYGADAGGRQVADAIRREVRVEPRGRPVERIVNGTLDEAATVDVAFPADAVEGSEILAVKLYPSSFSQVLEGLDGIFQRPYGCFEQTSSTTYPNVLALEYLRRTGQALPEVEAKAKQYIHLGYQRLLTFEVDGGGFDWFGNPPANVTLTAYGLMEFVDMARVHDVDPRLIERTRGWLLGRQRPDGSWTATRRGLRDGLIDTVGEEGLVTTAYVAWAVWDGYSGSRDAADRAAAFLRRVPPGQIQDPYTLALVAHALMAIDGPRAGSEHIDRLVRMASWSGEMAHWTRSSGRRTVFYGAGDAGNIEATALAALALMESGREPRLTEAALNWLVGQRDRFGTWQTTQATVLGLKALVEAAGRPLAGDGPRTVEILAGDRLLRTLEIAADQADVMQLVGLTPRVGELFPDGSGQLTLRDAGGAGGVSFQVVLRHHEEERWAKSSGEPVGPLDVRMAFDRTDARVGEDIVATARIRNAAGSDLPMVLLDLPVPPGFALDRSGFERLVASGAAARFEVTPRSVIVYLRRLSADEELRIEYTLRATTPVEVTVPPATAEEYYDPSIRGRSEPSRIRASV